MTIRVGGVIMRKIKLIICFILFACIAKVNVSALSCSNAVTKDLGQIAAYVKASYEVIDSSTVKELVIGEDKTTYYTPNFNFLISIYNITNDIYVEITDDVTNQNITVHYSDTDDGVYTFSNEDFGKIYTYTIKVLSANDDCYGEKVRTLTLVKPRYNAFSEYTYCKTSSSIYCQKFVVKETGLKNAGDFYSKIGVNNDKNKKKSQTTSETEKIISNIKDNWKLYLGVLVGTTIITTTIIFIYKRKKKMSRSEI